MTSCRPTLINKVEHDYLEIFIFQRIRDKISIKTNITITNILKIKKKEWLDLGRHWQAEPNWTVVKKSFLVEISTKTHNII